MGTPNAEAVATATNIAFRTVTDQSNARTGERASLLVFDIDRFKDVNDAFGHVEGDRVLKGLVELAGKRFRKLDALFRIGGEEFALLLSGTGFADALDAAEEFRVLVQDAGFLPEYDVSISIGVVELAFEQSVMDWLEEADSALYRAKRNGRNRVAGSARQRSRVVLGAERSPFAGAVNH